MSMEHEITKQKNNKNSKNSNRKVAQTHQTNLKRSYQSFTVNNSLNVIYIFDLQAVLIRTLWCVFNRQIERQG